MTLPLIAAACHRGSNDSAQGVQTQTIAPAAAQPAANGTDAMTQTVDVEDSRSVAEGDQSTAAQAAPAKTTKKAPAAAPKKKK